MENKKLRSLVKLAATINGDDIHWADVLDLMKVRVNNMLRDELASLDEKVVDEEMLLFVYKSIDNLSNFKELWGPMYSQLLTLHSEGSDPNAFLLQLALILLHTQKKARFECTLRIPTYIYIDSHAYVMKGPITVDFSNAVLSIKWDDAHKRFTQSAKRFNCELSQIKIHNAQIDIINSDREFSDLQFINGCHFSQSHEAEIIADCCAALDLIKKADKGFFIWISNVLRTIVFVKPQNNVIQSGSSAKHAGMIYLTHPINIEHLATLIVHECAHQYLHLIDELSPIVSDSCDNEYYSPYRQMLRPQYFVVIAMHACVNILKFINQYHAMNNGILSSFLEQERKEQEFALQIMLEQLTGSNGFTALGQLFFNELTS